jgi:hypothetical protein
MGPMGPMGQMRRMGPRGLNPCPRSVSRPVEPDHQKRIHSQLDAANDKAHGLQIGPYNFFRPGTDDRCSPHC